MPTENRSIDAESWISCDDGLYLILMDEKNDHYGWVFRKIEGSWPYSVRKATPHEMAHAQARQHLRLGVAQIVAQPSAPQQHVDPVQCAICRDLGDQCLECEEADFREWADRHFAAADYRKTDAGVFVQDWMRHAYAAWCARGALMRQP